MDFECFELSISNNIAHVVMKRPEKRNNMNAAFWNELPVLINDIDANVRARVIVISSTGPHFCGGIDVDTFLSGGVKDESDDSISRRQDASRFMNMLNIMQASFSALEASRLPGTCCDSGWMHWRWGRHGHGV
jgi:enoyl-CoA hydratase